MNDDKMIEVLAQIEKETSLPAALQRVGFNMSTWLNTSAPIEQWRGNVCGTTACLAGHALVADGWAIDYKHSMFVHPSGNWQTSDAETEGAKALGLTESEGCDVFYLENLDQVYERVAEMMGVDEQVLRDKVKAYQ